MAVSFKYWDDCIDPIDMEEMWRIPEVRTEWLDAGESREQKVHLSRDPDGQPYLTQTEMKVNQVASLKITNECSIMAAFHTFGFDSVLYYILVCCQLNFIMT